MHVWLVNPYGALPGESWREYRTVLAARALIAAGHTVTWWVANFEHRSKRFRGETFEVRPLFPGFEAAIVPTTGYTRHISLRRIRFERTFARRMRAYAPQVSAPDLIVLSEPALFTSGPTVALADSFRVPLVLDMVDLWPELFHIALPRALRRFGRFLFGPLYRRRAALVRRADGYVAATRDYLEVMTSIAPNPHVAVVYWGVDVAQLQRELREDTPVPPAFGTRRKGPDDFWVIYAGTLGPNYDIRTILRAAERLRDDPSITIIIAGEGAARGAVEVTIRERGLTNCVFLGPLPAATVTRLYARCDAVLSTYVADSTVSMPIKAFDAFAAGLPIVNSLDRDLGDFVAAHEVGVQYKAEDPDSLAAALRRMAGDPQLRERMARNAATLGAQFDSRTQYAGFVRLTEAVRATWTAPG